LIAQIDCTHVHTSLKNPGPTPKSCYPVKKTHKNIFKKKHQKQKFGKNKHINPTIQKKQKKTCKKKTSRPKRNFREKKENEYIKVQETIQKVPNNSTYNVPKETNNKINRKRNTSKNIKKTEKTQKSSQNRQIIL
jgi:hypothetical protein